MAPTFSSVGLGYSPALGMVDLVVGATGGGRGRVDIDRTPATPLLIAMGSDRRANPDDRIPGGRTDIFAKRGWVGDPLLPDGQRLGCRNWLLEDAKQDEVTRVMCANYTAEAVESVADYYGITIDTAAAWIARGVLQATAATSGTTIAVTVPTA
ncbi:phage GP46 family protein [Gluconacetobacter azotocaptans]|uniref:phage GP46 family protein n=1 Tax=Gluconacetobacter azotocaptans TaxID=142834 RepID=UPI00195CCD55|nr:phage GP46 family protein [Gluconacetobacter azotocaptans]MBM9400387.1 phage GP46 family protein [Gluconacetobacter azotocaptans]